MATKCVLCEGIAAWGFRKVYCEECYRRILKENEERLEKRYKENPNFMNDYIDRSWNGGLVFFGVMFIVAVWWLSWGMT